MELEPIEPTDGSFAAPRDLFEDFVALDAAIMTHHQGGGVDKGDPGRLPFSSVEVDTQGNQRGGNHGYKPVITEPLREGTSQVSTDIPQVVGFEVAVVRLMKMDQDRYDFA